MPPYHTNTSCLVTPSKDSPQASDCCAVSSKVGGTLYDLEYLVDKTGYRVAAFGYWAGYAGAAVALKCWAAQQRGKMAEAVGTYPNAANLVADLKNDLMNVQAMPSALVIGALGRVGAGASDLCAKMGITTTKWGYS